MERNRQSICLLAGSRVSTVRVDRTILWTEPEGLHPVMERPSGGYGVTRPQRYKQNEILGWWK